MDPHYKFFIQERLKKSFSFYKNVYLGKREFCLVPFLENRFFVKAEGMTNPTKRYSTKNELFIKTEIFIIDLQFSLCNYRNG